MGERIDAETATAIETIVTGGREVELSARLNNGGEWEAWISEDGWAWDGNDIGFATPEEALAAGRAWIAETVAADVEESR
jgi:hypothetical protein